ncbi:hypothetical protein [Kineosporia sp. A_224]|uniref:hypothetical protein n=1 Tax=Kineosporia sp. A_224 TaxID=1962180 RepID=UPI000B4B91FC|nr:hypothetical protein [Kineosporia sp. A_224]
MRTRRTLRSIVGPALLVGLVAGCSSPGAGAGSTAPAATPSRAAPPTIAVLPAGVVGAPGDLGPLVHVAADGDRTTVRGFDRTTRALLGTVAVDGSWVLPVVVPGSGPDGVTTGGSVVLAEKAPAAGRSRFTVLRAPFTQPPHLVDLAGAFEFDALSPDGTRLYLVEHLPPKGSQHYQVRWYDLAADRLDEAVVVDKSNIGEWMAGHPVSRVTSLDGAVVATMYERSGGEPFVHVLHTREIYAQCIDLPESLAGRGFTLGGSIEKGLVVTDAKGRVPFLVDLTDGRVTRGPDPVG